MQKFLRTFIPTLVSISFLLIGCFSLVPTAHAGDYGLSETARKSELPMQSSVPQLAGTIIGTALSIISVIFFILMVYGGFLWMTAHGDEGQVTKARETIVAAIIGIIVILASYAITKFVMNSVS